MKRGNIFLIIYSHDYIHFTSEHCALPRGSLLTGSPVEYIRREASNNREDITTSIMVTSSYGFRIPHIAFKEDNECVLLET